MYVGIQEEHVIVLIIKKGTAKWSCGLTLRRGKEPDRAEPDGAGPDVRGCRGIRATPRKFVSTGSRSSNTYTSSDCMVLGHRRYTCTCTYMHMHMYMYM